MVFSTRLISRDKRYDEKRKRKGKRGHGINLLWWQKDSFKKPCKFLSPSPPDPDFLNKLLEMLMQHRPADAPVNGSGHVQFTGEALSAARTQISEYESKRPWRIWLPTDVWSRFSMLKVLFLLIAECLVSSWHDRCRVCPDGHSTCRLETRWDN